jgi:hypothetical protein
MRAMVFSQFTLIACCVETYNMAFTSTTQKPIYPSLFKSHRNGSSSSVAAPNRLN